MNKAKILKSAEKYVLQGKFPAAVAEYQKILEFDPNDLSILNTIGDLYIRLGNTSEALKYFNQLATAYYDSGYKVKAIAIYKKITKLEPKSEAARQRLAELYALQGLMSEARDQYLQLAETYLSESKSEQAASALHKILSGDPNNVAVLKRLVEVEAARGNARGAVDLLVDAAERLRQRRDFAEAKSMLERAQDFGLDLPSIRLRLAKILFAEDQLEAAITLLREMDPDQSSPEVQLAIWECWVGARRLDEAGAVARRLFEMDATHFSLLLSLSDRYLESADFDHALQVLKPLIEAPSIDMFGGRLSDMLQKILSEDPDHLPTIELSVMVNRKLGQPHLVSLSLEHLASYYIRHEDFPAAFKVYKELLEIDPTSTAVREGMERLKRQMREPSVAEPEVTVKEAEPAAVDEAREDSGLSHPQEFVHTEMPQKGFPSAITFAAMEKEETRELDNKLMLEGEMLVSYGLLHRAAQAFEELLLVDPRHTAALKRLVEIYSALDRLADAAVCCVKLSKVAVKGGELSEARQWTQRATEFDHTIQSKAVEMATRLPSEPAPPALPMTEEPTGAESVESLYDLSGELEEIARAGKSEDGMAGASVAMPLEAAEGEIEAVLNETLQEIDFYMEQGFWAEAHASILRAKQSFPGSPSLDSRQQRCEAMMPQPVQPAEATLSQEGTREAAGFPVQEAFVQRGPQEPLVEKPVAMPGVTEGAGELGDILSEFNIGESFVDASGDFNTHYNLGIAFREMGLLEEAIAEVQKAVSILDPETQRQEYLSVCSLLGMCLVETKNFPEAVEWFERGVAILGEAEKSEEALSLRFDLANACELAGKTDLAHELFQKIHDDRPNFRDVERRLQAFERTEDSR